MVPLLVASVSMEQEQREGNWRQRAFMSPPETRLSDLAKPNSDSYPSLGNRIRQARGYKVDVRWIGARAREAGV